MKRSFYRKESLNSFYARIIIVGVAARIRVQPGLFNKADFIIIKRAAFDGYAARARLVNAFATLKFFEGMNGLIKSVPLDDWKTYLRWRVLHEAAPRLSAVP